MDYRQAILSTNAYRIVCQDKKLSRLSHTYLLLSEDVDYAFEFAKILAELVLDAKEGSTEQRNIQKGVHPDVIVFGQNEKINTTKATEIASDVYVRPYESDAKVYILLNMQNVLEDAQNKLLKTIEEPPKSAFFILVSTQEKKLLQTVLSRSKKIELDLLSKETIAELLKSAGASEKEINICASCSGGVFSRALKMSLDKDFLKLYQNVFKCLYKMNSSRDVLDYSSLFGAKTIDKNELADLFMLIVRDLIMVKTKNFELVSNSHKIDELKLIATDFSLKALYKIVEYCLQLKEDLVYNVSMTSAVDEFLLKVVEVKVKCKE